MFSKRKQGIFSVFSLVIFQNYFVDILILYKIFRWLKGNQKCLEVESLQKCFNTHVFPVIVRNTFIVLYVVGNWHITACKNHTGITFT